MNAEQRILMGRTLLAIATAVECRSAAASPHIADIGVLPGKTTSGAAAISADGTAVVGASGSRAFLWTLVGGIQDLGTLPGGTFASATGVSADGSWVSGTSNGSFAGTRAFRWSASTGMENLGTLDNGLTSDGLAISADGSTIAGSSNGPFDIPESYACVWTMTGGVRGLGLPADSWAYGASADGRVIVGTNGYSFRWTNDGIQFLVSLPGDTGSEAVAVSGDGSIIAGTSFHEDRIDPRIIPHAFRWNSAGQVQALGALPGAIDSVAAAISADGSTIGGSSGGHPFIWSESLGMRDLNGYLPTLGVDLHGWTLTRIAGLSFDGSTIAGSGLHDGQERAWVITGVPSPSAFSVVAVYVLIAAGRRQRVR